MNKWIINILKFACIFFFIGRGWQHFAFNPPYRVFLWNEDLLGFFINFMTPLTWQEYVASSFINNLVDQLIQIVGIFYLLMAFVTFFIKPWHKKLAKLYYLASFIMMGLAFTLYVDKGFHLGQFLEQSIQIMTPLFFVMIYLYNVKIQSLLNLIKLTIAFTFIGHGLFAVGFYPVPGNFVDMCISFFGFTEPKAFTFLRTIGTIDLACAFLLFIPRLEILALVFMSFWGCATASARLLSNIDVSLIDMSLTQWWYELVYRLPHGLIPFMLLLYFYSQRNNKEQNILERKLQPQLSHSNI